MFLAIKFISPPVAAATTPSCLVVLTASSVSMPKAIMILPALATCSRLNGLFAAISAKSLKAASASSTPPVKASSCKVSVSIRPAVATRSAMPLMIFSTAVVARLAAVCINANFAPIPPRAFPPSPICFRAVSVFLIFSVKVCQSFVISFVPALNFWTSPRKETRICFCFLSWLGVLPSSPLTALYISLSLFDSCLML